MVLLSTKKLNQNRQIATLEYLTELINLKF